MTSTRYSNTYTFYYDGCTMFSYYSCHMSTSSYVVTVTCDVTNVMLCDFVTESHDVFPCFILVVVSPE